MYYQLCKYICVYVCMRVHARCVCKVMCTSEPMFVFVCIHPCMHA